jgi:hypothetical protein
MPRPMRPVFTERWQAGMAETMRAVMPATLRLFRVGTPVYNPATNTYSDASTTLYTGVGRVQPLRSARYEPAPMDSAYWQSVLLSVPIEDVKTVDFRVGDQARVTACVLNPMILEYQYIVTEIIDSSNPLERTLLCSVSLDAEVT